MRSRLALVACTALAAVSVLAALALAAGHDATLQVSRIDNVNPKENAVATPTCPTGSRIVGGGVISPTQSGAGGSYGTHISGPLHESGSFTKTVDGAVARRWVVSAGHTSGAQQDYSIIALCSKSSDATIRTSATLNLPNNHVGNAVATCPAGTRVVGGGLITDGPLDDDKLRYSLLLNGPLEESGTTANTDDGDVARHWYSAVANGSGLTTNFKAVALCSATSDAIVEVERIDAVEAAKGASAVASCPPGRHVTGGGINSSTAPNPTGDLSQDFSRLGSLVRLTGPLDETGTMAATEQGDVARKWSAGIDNFSGKTQDYRVLALCETDVPSGPTGPTGPTGPSGPTGTQRLALTVAPKRVKVKQRRTFRFTVTTAGAPVEAATVTFAGKAARTAATGTVSIVARFKKKGVRTATASKAGFAPATATVRVRRR